MSVKSYNRHNLNHIYVCFELKVVDTLEKVFKQVNQFSFEFLGDKILKFLVLEPYEIFFFFFFPKLFYFPRIPCFPS